MNRHKSNNQQAKIAATFPQGRSGDGLYTITARQDEMPPPTTGIFDQLTDKTTFKSVPGKTNKRYAAFGSDDQLPYNLVKLIEEDEVCSQNIFFNAITCYAGGLQMQALPNAGSKEIEEVEEWELSNCLPSYFMEQCTDMKYFYFTVAVIILSKDGKRINRLIHKEAAYCRLEEADRRGVIANVYYGNFRTGVTAENIETIPLLWTRDPLGDLRKRMERGDRGRKFAILLRFPSIGQRYYPVPYYSSVFRGGSYDEKRMISAAKRAKLRNYSSVKMQVEVHRDYFQRIVDDEGITDPVEQKKRIIKEKEAIRDFALGTENADKAWISTYAADPDGNEMRDVRIQSIPKEKEGGDWGEDINIAANTMCYGFNVHPNLVGAVPGKSQSNNSGSDKRELFTMKQANETAFHHLLLIPLRIVCAYNGWKKTKPTVPLLLLTTLDQHTDLKKLEP